MGCDWSHGAFSSVPCALVLEMFPEDFHRLSPLRFLMLFEVVLWQVLFHPQYMRLYQQTLRLLMLFEAVLSYVLVHCLSHLSPYQQTQGFLVLSWGVLPHVLVHHLSLYQETLVFLMIF